MNKTELWNAVVARYPEFADDEFVIKQRARGLRRLLEQAWDEGHAAGSAKSGSSNDLYDKLFGKGFKL